MTLATWLTERFSNIGTQLNWTETSYNNIAADALELLAVSNESDVDARALHAVATYCLWKQALTDVSLDYNFSADGSSFSRSDLHTHISDNLKIAQADALEYLNSYVIDAGTLTSKNDPYSYDETRDISGNL